MSETSHPTGGHRDDADGNGSGRDLAGLPADEAIPRLLDEHGGRIYGLGLRLCGGEAGAEDLVQEVFLNAFRKWHRFEGRSAPSTWLYTIAVRACRRMHRKRAGEPARVESLTELLPSGETSVPDLTHGDGGPHAEQLRREAREAVAEALGALPVSFRLPVVLKDIAELTTPEIARILGIKPATVKTRVHRGRLRLRQALAERLPSRQAPPPDHERRVCLDLLHAKQEALDRGVEFPVAQAELCSRCRALFETLDLAHETCLDLGHGELPPKLRRVLLAELAAERS